MATPRFSLPLLASGQAQKEVTHNEALSLLDALVQAAVEGGVDTAPPASPAQGACWIVPAGASGAWAGRDGAVAVWTTGGWRFAGPALGMIVWDKAAADFLACDGAAWVPWAPTALQNMTVLGVGTAADAGAPFSAKLNKALWVARAAAEGGSGDLRFTFGKEAAANVASLLFQDAYSGRAELGLMGDDRFQVKVSADGAAWIQALAADPATGRVDFTAASPTAPTPAAGDATTRLATTAFVAGGLAGRQPLDATLTGLAGVATAADQLLYATGPDAFASTALTAFMRTVLDDTSAPAARTTLGAAARGANGDITVLSGLTTALSLAQGGTGATSEAAARTALAVAYYEEGSWTPTVTFDTPGTSTVGYAAQVGRYKRKENEVTLGFNLTFTPTLGTVSGNVLIKGLPFNALSGLRATGAVGVVNARFKWPSGDTCIALVSSTDGLSILVNSLGTSNTPSFFAIANLTDGASHQITGTMTYFIA